MMAMNPSAEIETASTCEEVLLQDLVSQVLNLANANLRQFFLGLGGDSITTQRNFAASLALEDGYHHARHSQNDESISVSRHSLDFSANGWRIS